jgi:hypothetical protein
LFILFRYLTSSQMRRYSAIRGGSPMVTSSKKSSRVRIRMLSNI